MKVIVPCAGKSTRFPGCRPKWMLTAPDGKLMVQKALQNIPTDLRDVWFVIRQEHDQKYQATQGLKRVFGEKTNIHVLSDTQSQSETVARTILDQKLPLDEPLFIKDSDSAFAMALLESSNHYVTTESLENCDWVQPANKSYVRLNENQEVVDIQEKKILSKHFITGGYFFRTMQSLVNSYERCRIKLQGKELFLSHLFAELIQRGEVVKASRVESYQDWGTLAAWHRYTSSLGCYVIDIDGVLITNSSQYFEPTWGTTQAIDKNVQALKKLKLKGNQIFLLTARPENKRTLTEEQLKQFGVPYDKLIMGCLHGRRYLVNDFAKSNPYPSAVAINLPRNSAELHTLLEATDAEA